jgi:hypothetical protein
MKKEYIKPAVEQTVIDTAIILAGSGPNASDQSDPTLSREDDDLWGADNDLLIDNSLMKALLN